MSLKLIHPYAISVNLNDLGLKLAKRYGILMGLIISVVPLHELSNTLLSRLEYAAASSGHFDRACLMNKP